MELPVLIIMVVFRAVMLRRRGITAIVFGKTDKSDFVLVPIVLFFFYGITSSVVNLPFPGLLKKYFFEIGILNTCAIFICTISLIWFFVTLITFGNSFRVGIDENTNDKLITNGTFGISRNPVYVAFIAFFLGIFLACPNITSIVFLTFLVLAIHRQILREEKFLHEHYGKEYDDYCKHVRRYF
jgi:protein-S-isoprenylcysteine O-methyltransferase Ste14